MNKWATPIHLSITFTATLRLQGGGNFFVTNIAYNYPKVTETNRP